MATTATLIRDMPGTVWDSPDNWTKNITVPAGAAGQLHAVPNNKGIARLVVRLENGTTADIIVHPGDVSQSSQDTTPTGMKIQFCYPCGYAHPVGRSHCTRCGRASLFINDAGTCLHCTAN